MKRVVTASSRLQNHDRQADTVALDPAFSVALIDWQKQHGRHLLPWQNTRDAYRIWLSEIMLQQTQVAAVIPYYQRFLERFPEVQSLAAAPIEEVMAYWSGLGYYTRARNLHRCAQRVCTEYDGVFPADPRLLADLPGIGRSTAAAISAFAYGTRAAILDGNVKRVFCRIFGIEGYPGAKSVEDRLWRYAEALLPEQEVEAYTQGLMDLGATLCTRTRPACQRCPMQQRCNALATNRIAQLPVKKPKKALPEKRTGMLLVIHRDKILLEQRPGTGIWGGLLSLPELPEAAQQEQQTVSRLIEQAIMRFGKLASYQSLPHFTHVFSHFKLHIEPIQVELAERFNFAGETGHVWYDAADLSHAPLPAPVKRLLLQVFDQSAIPGHALSPGAG